MHIDDRRRRHGGIEAEPRDGFPVLVHGPDYPGLSLDDESRVEPDPYALALFKRVVPVDGLDSVRREVQKARPESSGARVYLARERDLYPALVPHANGAPEHAFDPPSPQQSRFSS